MSTLKHIMKGGFPVGCNYISNDLLCMSLLRVKIKVKYIHKLYFFEGLNVL